jgi:nitrogen fixation-related uncharacterized protein
MTAALLAFLPLAILVVFVALVVELFAWVGDRHR